MWPFSTMIRSRREERSSNPWLGFEDLLDIVNTSAGVAVTQKTAVTHPAVFRCVDLNANTIGSFPIDVMVKRGDRREDYPVPQWMRKPNDYQDFNGLVAEAQASQELYDSAFLLKTTNKANGQLIGLAVLDPTCVEVTREKVGGRTVIVYDVQLAEGKVRLAQNEVVHIKAGLPIPAQLRGQSVVSALRETIGTGIAAREFGANFFGTGATLSGVIEMDASYNEEQTKRIKESMQRKHGGVSKSHAIGILTGGAKWKALSVAPNESQFLETQGQVDGYIASAFGIPIEYVNGKLDGAKGYVTGLYQRQMLWYQTGLFPRITRNERAFSSLLPGGAYIKFNVN